MPEDDLAHARIDKLIDQLAVEIGLLRTYSAERENLLEVQQQQTESARRRLRAADDAAREEFYGPDPRVTVTDPQTGVTHIIPKTGSGRVKEHTDGLEEDWVDG